MQHVKSSLTLTDLTVEMFLGAFAEEKGVKRKIKIDISINFLELPQAAQTDILTDTICYDQLSKKIQMFALTRHFNLIENFTLELFNFLKKKIFLPHNLTLSVTKDFNNRNLSRSVFTIAE